MSTTRHGGKMRAGQRWREWVRGLGLVLALSSAASPVGAQADSSGRWARRWTEGVSAGSEVERYLRIAQLSEAIPMVPWGVRAFSPHEIATLTPRGATPWGTRFSDAPTVGWWVVRPQAELIANSAFPWGLNDGPTWAGRGLTAVATGGAAFRRGAFSGQVAPHLWWAQNVAFDLLPSSPGANLSPYHDYGGAMGIDLPQRFGDAATARLELGESFVRVDAFGLAAGLSSQAEWSGPGVTAGGMLSNQAAGIPRVFVGTSSPMNIGIGRAHGRVFAGQARSTSELRDSLTNPTRRQLAMGMIATFAPRGLPGLEVGGTRIFQRHWREGGPQLRDFDVLFLPFLKKDIQDRDNSGVPENQLAAAYARLAVPRAGMEVYAEYAREDHSSEWLDLVTEPDHDAYTHFGFVKQLRRTDSTTWWVVRGETVNGRTTHLDNVRPQVLFYAHVAVRAGHTQRGQLLGSPWVRGGSGAELAVDRYDRGGRMTVRWLRQGLATSQQGGLGYGAINGLEASGLRFMRHGDLLWRAGLQHRSGANGVDDATNLSAAVGWRVRR